MTKIKVSVGIYQNSTTGMTVDMSTAKGSIDMKITQSDVTAKTDVAKMKLSLQDAQRLRDGLTIIIKNFEKI